MSSCGCCCGCAADSSAEVKAALDNWLAAVSAGGPDKVMKLYTENAVLLPTLAPGVHETSAKRLGYFKVFTAKKNLKGKIDELHTRIYGDTAINSGLYTFTFEQDGKTASAPARFTFVYNKTPQGWMIVEHHSSLVPAGH